MSASSLPRPARPAPPGPRTGAAASRGLEIEGLSVDYRTPLGLSRAVSDVAFALEPGERMAIVGESGSGKSTLATALAGLIPQELAQVSVEKACLDGAPLDLTPSRSMIPVRRNGISMIFQDAMTSLDPVATIGSQFRSVLENLHGRISKKEAAKTGIEWIERVGIHQPERVLKLRPYELSGGMRQRVMIALSLCSDPRLLVADEPTSALDASVSIAVMELLLELTREFETSLIMITHDIELARKYTQKTLVLYRGEVSDYCATDALFDAGRSDYTRALLACVPRLSDHGRERLSTLTSVLDIVPPEESKGKVA